MNEGASVAPPRLGWRFPQTFWIANGAELLERAAYYGMAIALAHYLTEQIGFTDIGTGIVAGLFASVLYLLPTFSGIMADRIGFRRALLLAFALLTLGYALLGVAGLKRHAGGTGSLPPATTASTAPTTAEVEASGTGGERDQHEQAMYFPEVPRKLWVALALAIVMFGGSIIKPVITGTVAKCSDEAHRARAFSIFYAMVNIGAFTGKSVAVPLRTGFTVPFTDIHLVLGLEYINFYAAAMALCALIFVALLYRNPDTAGAGKTFQAALDGLVRVIFNVRFIMLILIVAGFWVIQHQLYASMTKYVLRLLGDTAKPEWLANINPLVVVLLVLPITHLVRRVQPANSIAIALAIIPLSSLVIALSPYLQTLVGGNHVPIFGGLTLHPITVMISLGIALQGLAECFLSPKFLEYASKQAPPGEVGLYMGYMHLSSFFAYFFGFIISGFLLDWYCPDPKTLPAEVQAQRLAAIAGQAEMPAAYARAHYIWFVFAAIGVGAFVALLIFKYVTAAIDRRRAG